MIVSQPAAADRYFEVKALHLGSATDINVWCLGVYPDGRRMLRGLHPSEAEVGRCIDVSKTRVEYPIEEHERLVDRYHLSTRHA